MALVNHHSALIAMVAVSLLIILPPCRKYRTTPRDIFCKVVFVVGLQINCVNVTIITIND